MNLDTDRLRSQFQAEVQSIEQRRILLQSEMGELDARLRGVEASLEALKAVEKSVQRLDVAAHSPLPDRNPDSADGLSQRAAAEASEQEESGLFGEDLTETTANQESPPPSEEPDEVSTSFLENNGLIPSFLRRHL